MQRAVGAAVLPSAVPAEADPEVSVCRAELCDELLYDLLLGRGFHAQQLPAVPSAGQSRIFKVQPPPELGEVSQLVTRLPFPCLAHALTCIRTYMHPFTDASQLTQRARNDFIVGPVGPAGVEALPTSGFEYIRFKSQTSSTETGGQAMRKPETDQQLNQELVPLGCAFCVRAPYL